MLDLHIHADRAREIVAEYGAETDPKERRFIVYQGYKMLEGLLEIHDRNQGVGK